MISTHTLRKEGDRILTCCTPPARSFQPTPSARRVTLKFVDMVKDNNISTHTLRKEGDFKFIYIIYLV